MQRYRINYKLLIGLIIGIPLGLAALIPIWSCQVEENATWFMARAEEAIEQDDLRKALQYLEYYVKFRPDELDAQVRLAHVSNDIANMIGATREDLGTAFFLLDETVRKSNDQELRRKLIEMQMRIGRSHDAIAQIDELLNSKPDDSELKALKVRCLFLEKNFVQARKYAFDLIGYVKSSGTFDSDLAEAEDQPEIFATLASNLLTREQKKELARAVIDRMVEVNPENAQAQLKYSVMIQQLGEEDLWRPALDKAYELDPTDALVLQQKGAIALQDEDLEMAARMFGEGLEQNPESQVFYRLLAIVEVQQEQLDKALATLEKGVERFGVDQAYQLILLKIELLFGGKDFPAIEKEIERLADLNIPELIPMVQFHRAKIKYSQKQWAQAAASLRRVRPLLSRFAEQQKVAGAMLGLCQEKLGSHDLALQSYELVLQNYPDFAPAVSGRRRMKLRLGQTDVSNEGQGIDDAIKKMMELPEEEQNWSAVEEQITQFAERQGWSEGNTSLIRAQVFAQRKMFPEARKLIQEAREVEPDNERIALTAVQIFASDPEGGVTDAMRLLDEAEENFGAGPTSRLLRANLLVAIGAEDLKDQLWALTTDMEEWSVNEQASVWSAVGTRFQQLQLAEEASKCLEKAVELTPDNLPTCMALFDHAFQQKDDEAMRRAQELVLDIVQDEKSGSYLLTEVKRRISGYGQKKVTKEELIEAKEMLDTALIERPTWHQLHILYGQIVLVTSEDVDLALTRFDDALRYGPPSLNTVALQVRLLAARERFAEAGEKMKLLPKAVRKAALGRLEADILIKTGEKEAAFESAQAIAAKLPEDAAVQLWFSKIANQAGHLEEAVAATKLTLELNDSNPDVWFQLVQLYMTQRKPDEIERTLREAHLALDAEYLPLLTAKYYELRSSWQDAEDIYLTAYSKRLDDVLISRRMADFYLRWVKKDPMNGSRATPYINRVLRAANEGQIPTNDPQAVWARRKAARLLASTGRYQQVIKATRLLQQGAEDGELNTEDQLLIAEILATRSDPESMLKAIEILSGLQERGLLSRQLALTLGRLLHGVAEFQRSDSQMLDVISQNKGDFQVWASYIDMLIERGEYTRAKQGISRLENLDSASEALTRLKAKLASATGDNQELRRSLQKLLPGDVRRISADQLPTLQAVAKLAADLDDQEFARQLYSLYIEKDPSKALVLANYLCEHGSPEHAFRLLESMSEKKTDLILRLGVNMLRSRRGEFGDRFDDDYNQLVRSALRKEPDSAQRLLCRAEALEIQEQFDEAVEAYELLLDRDDVPTIIRASAMNNLGFLLALLDRRLDDAERLVDEAMQIFGPISDMLDTRAVVKIAQQDYEGALHDMHLAVRVGPTAAKYFHLALAEIRAGNERAGLEAWDEAVKLGLDAEAMQFLEQETYQKLDQEVQAIRSESAQL